MRFTNNRLTGLQTDITWLGSSRLSRIQQNYKYTWLGFSLVHNNTKETFAQKSATYISVIPCLVVGVVKGVGFLRVGRGELGVTVGGLVGVVYRVFQ